MDPAVITTMLDDYYQGRGWDINGNPTRGILEALDLPHAADNLEKPGQLGNPLPSGIPSVRGLELKPQAM